MSLPLTSRTRLTALVAYTPSKAHSFCFPRDGEALSLLSCMEKKEQPHKFAGLVNMLFSQRWSLFIWLCLAVPVSALHGWEGSCACTQEPGVPQAPARHGPLAQWHPSPVTLPWPDAACPSWAGWFSTCWKVNVDPAKVSSIVAMSKWERYSGSPPVFSPHPSIIHSQVWCFKSGTASRSQTDLAPICF